MSSSTEQQNNQQNQSPIANHRWVKKLFLIIFIIIVGVIGYRAVKPLFTTKDKAAHTPSQPVAITTVLNKDMPVRLTELGTVIPIANVTIQTRVSGYLEHVYFKEGEQVKKGDLLALIDPRPYEALKEQYEGTLKADTALLQQAKLDNGRYQKLLKQNSIAPMTAQDQQYKVAQLEGQIKTDTALIRQQELNIIYCHIRAPADGRVGIRQVDAGNYVTEGQSGGLATLTQMSPISVIFTVPENNLGMVVEEMKKQSSLPVEAWNSDNTTKLAEGKTSVIDSQIDTSTGTVRLRAIFANKQWELFPNQFVNTRLLAHTLHNVIVVPNNAIQTGPNGPFVYIVNKNLTVKLKNIKTGYDDGENTVIQSGLSSGEKVVTDGIDQLHDGSKITIPSETKASTK